MIDASAVNAIAELARDGQEIQQVEIGGIPFTNIALHDARKKLPEPTPLVVHTLSGLVDYVMANRDALTLTEMLVHVVGPARVDLLTPVRGDFQQRLTFLSAQMPDRFAGVPVGFAFGRWLDLESLTIALSALFEDTGDRAAVLKLLGSIVNDASVKRTDDGFSQSVTAKSGIALVESVKVPNPVMLAPFRTFPEAGQPTSPFLLRLAKDGEGVRGALFEADGGAWRTDAVHSISSYLGDELPNGIAVVA